MLRFFCKSVEIIIIGLLEPDLVGMLHLMPQTSGVTNWDRDKVSE